MPQQCARCRALHGVPRHRCPRCGSTSFTTMDHPATGTIDSWTELRGDAIRPLVLVAFANGTKTFGELVGDRTSLAVGAMVEHVEDLPTESGPRRVYRLASLRSA